MNQHETEIKAAISGVRVHSCEMKTGISRTHEFEKKGLATHAINIGTKCGHGCLYCSTGPMLRMHKSFQLCGENPFEIGYAIFDPMTHERVSRDAKRIQKRGMVQLCTVTDAYAPEAQDANLGRKCLQAMLSEPGWNVRILTKNAAVKEDYGYIRQHRKRVLVGISITGTPDRSDLVEIIEPNASGIKERMSALQLASAMGLRTYAMFCPLFPGIADSPDQIDRLVRFAVYCNAEEIFVEPVNARGSGMRLCQQALDLWGYEAEAKAIGDIRRRDGWSCYVVELIKNVQNSVRRYSKIEKLRFLLYPKRLTAEALAEITKDDEGVIWL